MEHMSSILEHSAVRIAINRNCEVTNSEEGVRGREREREREKRGREKEGWNVWRKEKHVE